MQIFFNFHISSSIYHNHVIGADNLFFTRLDERLYDGIPENYFRASKENANRGGEIESVYPLSNFYSKFFLQEFGNIICFLNRNINARLLSILVWLQPFW